MRIIGISFVPISFSIVIPTYFQAIGMGKQSIILTVLRQIVLLIPLAWAFSLLGVDYVWWAFPTAEMITAATACILYRKYPMKEPAGLKEE